MLLQANETSNEAFERTKRQTRRRFELLTSPHSLHNYARQFGGHYKAIQHTGNLLANGHLNSIKLNTTPQHTLCNLYDNNNHYTHNLLQQQPLHSQPFATTTITLTTFCNNNNNIYIFQNFASSTIFKLLKCSKPHKQTPKSNIKQFKLFLPLLNSNTVLVTLIPQALEAKSVFFQLGQTLISVPIKFNLHLRKIYSGLFSHLLGNASNGAN